MEETAFSDIAALIDKQRAFFATHQTKELSFRIQQLKKLQKTIREYEKHIAEALWKDLRKSPQEAYLTEIGLVLDELRNHIRHLKHWAKDKRVGSPLFLFPSKSRIHYEPLGVALIVSPWNYPFQLLINPLIGAISAGCCAILKASPYAPHTARIVETLIRQTFPENHIALVQGNRQVNQFLFSQKLDLIFFTGSPALGRVVMSAAAKHLTPCILELGGKSPCIVDRQANLRRAAKRIVWGKTVNAGQTCIAPDYLFVHKDIKEDLLKEMKSAIQQFFGDDPRLSPYYPRIVNKKAMERLKQLLSHGNILSGGEVDEEQGYIAPTLIDNIGLQDPIMQEEIFGPLLPVMTFENIQEVLSYINTHEKPLALYYFGNSKKAGEVLRQSSSGGVCINDTLMHISNARLPFGGVGNSGMGKYHGKRSFLAFSNERAIVKTPTCIDLPMRYAPFKYLRLVRKLLG